MQFLVETIGIRCPICDSLLTTVKEQDRRVHIMLHPYSECPWSNVRYRIERISGYGEPWPSVKEEESCESSDETRTSTTTSVPSLCTNSRSVTRHTPRDTRAEAPGRIRR